MGGSLTAKLAAVCDSVNCLAFFLWVAVQLFVSGFRLKGVTADQEENLLQQLTEITRVMQEGQLVEKLAPGKKSQDGWEGTRTTHHTETQYNPESPPVRNMRRSLKGQFVKCQYLTLHSVTSDWIAEISSLKASSSIL